MKITPILCLQPRFHYWKDFGAGKKRRIPYYKQWWNMWRYSVLKKKPIDYTLPISQLPPGSRVMDAEDFMVGHIDLLPDELIKRKNEKIVYDHPWPYNYQMDQLREKNHCYAYDIETRFYMPRLDCLALTNTILESDELQANPPFEPVQGDIDAIQRQYDWSTNQDSVLTRLPRRRQAPKINIRPTSKYGPQKERKETNVLSSMLDFSQTLLARHYHAQKNQAKLDEILSRRTTTFPRCNILSMRDNEEFSINLTIDYLTVSKAPLPLIEPNFTSTQEKELVEIKPRTWRSLLEKTKQYDMDTTLTLPPDACLHTIQLASRTKRDQRDPDEMLARCMVHAFGLAFRYKQVYPISGPVVIQTIGFDLVSSNFHFLRYQLNSIDFNGPIKNQAWCSKPINNLEEAVRYYLDFQSRSGDQVEVRQKEAISAQT